MKIPIIKENPDDKGYISTEELFAESNEVFKTITKQISAQNENIEKSVSELNTIINNIEELKNYFTFRVEKLEKLEKDDNEKNKLGTQDIKDNIYKIKDSTDFKIEKIEKTLKVKDVVLNEYKSKFKKLEEEDKKNKNEIKIHIKKSLNSEKDINSKIEELENYFDEKLMNTTVSLEDNKKELENLSTYFNEKLQEEKIFNEEKSIEQTKIIEKINKDLIGFNNGVKKVESSLNKKLKEAALKEKELKSYIKKAIDTETKNNKTLLSTEIDKYKKDTEAKLAKIDKHIVEEAKKVTTALAKEKTDATTSLNKINTHFSEELLKLEKKYNIENKLSSIIEKQDSSLNSFKQELKEIKDYFKEELKRVEDKHIVKMDTQPKKIYGLSNVTAPSMIEKTITPGTIRYDKDTDTYRICKKSGWETLKL